MHCACLLVSKKTCNVHKKGNLRRRMGSETKVISPIMAKLEMAKKSNFMLYDLEFLPLGKSKEKKIAKRTSNGKVFPIFLFLNHTCKRIFFAISRFAIIEEMASGELDPSFFFFSSSFYLTNCHNFLNFSPSFVQQWAQARILAAYRNTYFKKSVSGLTRYPSTY